MTFPIDKVREKFPALSIKDDGVDRVYFDNPAGTQVSQDVVDATSHAYVHANANLGGAFRTSDYSGAVVKGAHQAMADFLGTDDAGEIIIGQTATNLGFHMSRSIARDFKPGDEIIVTRMDHEGNVSPWLTIAEDKGCVIKWLEFNTDSWKIEVDALKALLSEKTKLVALNYASNLTGMINDVKTLTAAAKEVGAIVYVDSVQYTPHGLTSVKEIGCDFLVCSSYKFFGPHMGILWGRRELLESMTAYKVRCAPTEIPDKFETGTPAIELLAGLTATIDYFAWIAEEMGVSKSASRREKIEAAVEASLAYEEGITKALIDGLLSIDGVKIYGATGHNQLKERVPTVSFRHDKVDPETIAKGLADRNIFVWNGHNYAYEVVQQLGISVEEGVVRVGPTHYNTIAEVEKTVAAIKEIVS